jgi:hypothetical protein
MYTSANAQVLALQEIGISTRIRQSKDVRISS